MSQVYHQVNFHDSGFPEQLLLKFAYPCPYRTEIYKASKIKDWQIKLGRWPDRNDIINSSSQHIARKRCMQYLSRLLRSEEHTSELQSRGHFVFRLLLEKIKE